MTTTIKIKRSSTTGSVPSTSDLALGELAINTYDGKLFFKKDISGTESIATLDSGISSYTDSDVEDYLNGEIAVDIIPAENETYSLGSPTKRFLDLYLAGTTINIGGATISSDGTGQISISGSGATLPPGSKIAVDTDVEEQIAVVGESGSVTRFVPFYTQSGGLSTVAKTFTFRASPESLVFTNFTFEDGDSITQAANDIQFYF